MNTKIYLAHLHVSHVHYEHFTTMTKNFTNSMTRLNCAKVKRVITEEVMVHSKDF